MKRRLTLLWGHTADIVRLAESVQSLDPVAAESIAIQAPLLVLEVRECRQLLDEVSREVGTSTPAPLSRRELQERVDQLESRIDELRVPRERLESLAGALSAGRLIGRSSRKQESNDQKRSAAVAELKEAANRQVPPSLPGEGAGRLWVEWFSSLDQRSVDDVLNELESELQALANFLQEFEPRSWEWEVSPNSELLISPAPPSGRGVAEASPGAREGAVLNDVPSPHQEGRPESPEHAPEEVRVAVEQALSPMAREVGIADAEVPMRSDIQLPPAFTHSDPLPAALPPAPEPRNAGEKLAHPLREHKVQLPKREPTLKRKPTPPSVSTADAEIPPTQPAMDVELKEWDEFQKARWISGEGNIEPAPWLDQGRWHSALRSGVDGQLARAAAADDQQLSEMAVLWIYASNMSSDARTSVHKEEVVSFCELWMEPSSASSGQDSGRHLRLKAAVDEARTEASTGRMLRTTLEALRPHRLGVAPFSTQLLEDLVAIAGFRSADLREVVEFLIRSWMSDPDPLERLRRMKGRQPRRSEAQVEEDLRKARLTLKQEFSRLWSAAGGKIARTHCRKAWEEWVRTAKPTFDRLGAEGSALQGPALQELEAQVKGLIAEHDEIADRHVARYQDRHQMDRAAKGLVDTALEVIKLRMELPERSRASRPFEQDIPLEAYNRLEATSRLGNDEEELCRRLLLRCVHAVQGTADPMCLTRAQLFSWPALWRQVPFENVLPKEPLAASPGDVLVHASHLRDPRDAAALLLESPVQPVEASELVEQWLTSGRVDLLAALQPWLSRAQGSRVLEVFQTLQSKVMVSHATLVKKQRQLSALASPAAQAVERAVHPPGEVITGGSGVGRLTATELRLLANFLEIWTQWADGRLRDSRASLAEQAERLIDGRAREVHAALEREDYTTALFLLNGGDQARHSRDRETLWRWSVPTDDAAADRLLSLGVEGQGQSDPDAQDLISKWTACIRSPGDGQARRYLRQSLSRFIRRPGQTEEEDGRQFVLDLRAFRQHLDRSNPTFIPQMKRFSRLIITSPEVVAANKSISQELAKVQENSEHSLIIFPVPGLGSKLREEAIEAIRRKDRPHVVLDNVDLYRLVHMGGPRGERILSLIEIALEQLPAMTYLPFQVKEGQNIDIEMFVGRQDLAKKLVLTAEFTRLFSGRKLGKTALLKYVESQFSGTKLPSDNILHVVYVPIVGVEAEDQVVAQVVSRLEAQLNCTLQAPSDLSPADRLKVALGRLLRDQPTTSLLIVLDEADVFVETQVERYEEQRERCLSFRMRTDAYATPDTSGLPRVRFLFSGYRATQTQGGAWANWGQVMTLDPLDPDDAIRLIEGPLARLGIDVSEHAGTIAWRCGYQPAVLLQFGRTLVHRLKSSGRIDLRATAQVSIENDDVAIVAESQQVKEELRTIVSNNFQGNNRSRIVFLCLLELLSTRNPGEWIEDACAAISTRLSENSSDNSWLTDDAGFPEGEIDRILVELEARKLIISEGKHSRRVRLLFPHHLTVLLQPPLGSGLRAEISKALSDRPSKSVGWPSASLFPLSTMADINVAFEMGLPVVAGGFWPELLWRQGVGLPERVQVEERDVHDVTPELIAAGIERTAHRHAFRNVAPASVDPLLEMSHRQASPQLLMMGGVSLLRSAYLSPERGQRFEVVAYRRLDLANFKGLLTRSFGGEFEDDGDLEKLWALTGGIGLVIERLMPHFCADLAQGFNAPSRRVREVIDQFGADFEVIASSLTLPEHDYCLSRRELDLLQACICVSHEHGFSQEVELWKEITSDWDLYAAQLAEMAEPTVEDASAVEFLSMLGLLPLNKSGGGGGDLSRLSAFSRGDPILKIGAHLFPRLKIESE